MEKITEILLSDVLTESGQHLGRVFELRCHGEPEHGASNSKREVSELICGKTGLLELFGLKRTDVKRVPWEFVKRIETNTVVIDDNYKSKATPPFAKPKKKKSVTRNKKKSNAG